MHLKNRIFWLTVCLMLSSSCVKQRSCTCTSTHLDLPDYHFTETIYYTATKKSAVENCSANGDTEGPVITSCELN